MSRRALDPVEYNRRRMRAQFRLIMAGNVLVIGIVVAVAAWLVTHPDSIGAFFRAIANGFSDGGAA
ncbi:hypothetical protein [Sphingomonas dokdonensis]|uniref:Uncharacterized protein n=1 Tax=Sphingomonas dokdonensis TaxID=344880 RepID=A0A245ZWH6_9SPHN|nr:hypothetical protein [Sphingomonas dokdonensis]OWK34087.1 hypothetical protein SPDO_09780 [Sphingomonas dokdonensis]